MCDQCFFFVVLRMAIFKQLKLYISHFLLRSLKTEKVFFHFPKLMLSHESKLNVCKTTWNNIVVLTVCLIISQWYKVHFDQTVYYHIFLFITRYCLPLYVICLVTLLKHARFHHDGKSSFFFNDSYYLKEYIDL